jgi:nucleoside-diphosphate-sugar epimerase
MRIVVTGLSGNVGTALLHRLLADGGHEIVGVVRRPPGDDEPYRHAGWVALDVAQEGATRRLQETFAGADAVVHLAWGFQPSHVPEYLDRVGIEGTEAVLRAADAAGVGHLVHLSSLGVYSPAPPPDADGTPVRVDESYHTDGIGSLAYSKEKVAAERLLDAYEKTGSGRMVVTRMRPALIVQGAAGSGLLRYGLPPFVPSSALALVKVVPLPPDLVVQGVHTPDVADAIARALERRSGGAFNLAADPPLTASRIAAALGARLVPVPRAVLRGLVAATWNLGLQPLDPGWLDLAFTVPLLSSERARRELGWTPQVDAQAALEELVDGMRTGAGAASAPLRPRSVAAELRDLVTRGPISHRRLP